MDNNNQLSRYGAIAKFQPLLTGKSFFLISSTETAAGEFLDKFPPDGSGATRVFTTWAAVITATQASTDADAVFVSPLFTTAPTAAQRILLEAAGVVTYQMGNALLDGTYFANKAPLDMSATTTNNLFQVNGRIELLDIIGQVATTIGATTMSAKFSIVPTVGSTTDLCATTDISSLAAGGQILITGTLATALTKTVQGAVVRQATPLIIKDGTLVLATGATNTGNIAYKVRYKPLEPGAFVSSL
jgi:hypothetical protein